MSHLILRDSIRMVDLVAENDKGNLGELFHREKGVELSLGLLESLVVLGVDKEDNAVDLGEVVAPDTSCYKTVLDTFAGLNGWCICVPCW